jgi:aspartate aminotransferase
MTRLATRVALLSESPTLAIDAKAKAMQAEGIKIINLAAGEPDFDTPDQVKNAAKAALDAGRTKYIATQGLPDLRTALAEKLKTENHLDYKPSEILVSTGGKQSLFNIILTIVERGDEFIIPAPFWVSYVDMVKAAEGTPVILPTTAEADFKITPAQLRASITDRTVGIVLNSPSNPTGSVYTRAELEALAQVIVEKNILCISDEIYEKLTYDGYEHFSIAQAPGMKERTFTMNGFSKTYSMTGWRLGYCAGPAAYISAMNTLQSHSTSNATTFAQFGAVEAIRNAAADAERMRKAFDERRQWLIPALNALPGTKCNTPRGAFYAFPDMSGNFGKVTPGGKTIQGSMDLAEYILVEGKVGVVPGSAFGAEPFMRMSYATSLENLKEGVDRMARVLAALKG